MFKPRWCYFFDFHTMRSCPDVGVNFDIDALVEHFAASGVDMVAFPARCNQGLAYYDTKIGIVHPSLKSDIFGKLVNACHVRGIKVTAYLNGGISEEEGLRRRDWLVVQPDGRAYAEDRTEPGHKLLCYNTGYGNHLLAMIEEIADRYPVSGFFIDCMAVPPCIGLECVKEMKELGLDCHSANDLHEHAKMSKIRMAKRISGLVKSKISDPLLYFNGVHFEEQKNLGTYLELECLPTYYAWGYDLLPYCGRYMRTLGKPVINMTGRFNFCWGDFGGIRTEAGLEYDCVHGISLGMGTNIGDHMHPRGDVYKPVFNMCRNIYNRLQKLDPWIEDAKGLAELAVVTTDPYPGGLCPDANAYKRSFNSGKAAVRMLCEEKHQFDVISDASSWTGYKTLVLPDDIRINDDRKAKLEKHLQLGGTIISTGKSGLDPEGKGFAMSEWGLKYGGESAHNPAFLQVFEKLAKDVPDMPLMLYKRGIKVLPREGTELLAGIVAPYYNSGWDGEEGFFYLPPDKISEEPGVTFFRGVFHAAHPWFQIYGEYAPVYLKSVLRNILSLALPRPMIRVENVPSFARVNLTSQAGRRIAHVMSYLPERRGNMMDVVEESVNLRDVVIYLRVDEEFKPSQAYLAPEYRHLDFTVDDGYAKVVIPVVEGHSHLVFEI